MKGTSSPAQGLDSKFITLCDPDPPSFQNLDSLANPSTPALRADLELALLDLESLRRACHQTREAIAACLERRRRLEDGVVGQVAAVVERRRRRRKRKRAEAAALDAEGRRLEETLERLEAKGESLRGSVREEAAEQMKGYREEAAAAARMRHASAIASLTSRLADLIDSRKSVAAEMESLGSTSDEGEIRTRLEAEAWSEAQGGLLVEEALIASKKAGLETRLSDLRSAIEKQATAISSYVRPPPPPPPAALATLRAELAELESRVVESSLELKRKEAKLDLLSEKATKSLSAIRKRRHLDLVEDLGKKSEKSGDYQTRVVYRLYRDFELKRFQIGELKSSISDENDELRCQIRDLNSLTLSPDQPSLDEVKLKVEQAVKAVAQVVANR